MMRRLVNKIKSRFGKKNGPFRGVSECPVCGSTNIDNIGKDKYCKDCRAVL